jgi:DNA polymerase III alpha subunit
LEVGETIQQERQKHGNFTSLENFCTRCGNILNKKSLEGIIKAGALDIFNDRKVLLDHLEVILDWIKNSANADQGLFGGMETSISLKKTTPSTLMERLMMEQEVFKAFISGNPLDGLYTYAKKFSFLSVVKEKKELKNFIIIGYIKNIQRAKKKGFFIKIEDITDSFEFFVTDPCGLEKFDVVIVHGYKNDRIRVNKIIKTSHATLKTLAGSAYHPEETVIKVKKARYGESKQAELMKLKEEKVIIENKAEGNKQDIVDEMETLEPEIDEEQENEQEVEQGNATPCIETALGIEEQENEPEIISP